MLVKFLVSQPLIWHPAIYAPVVKSILDEVIEFFFKRFSGHFFLKFFLE